MMPLKETVFYSLVCDQSGCDNEPVEEYVHESIEKAEDAARDDDWQLVELGLSRLWYCRDHYVGGALPATQIIDPTPPPPPHVRPDRRDPMTTQPMIDAAAIEQMASKRVPGAVVRIRRDDVTLSSKLDLSVLLGSHLEISDTLILRGPAGATSDLVARMVRALERHAMEVFAVAIDEKHEVIRQRADADAVEVGRLRTALSEAAKHMEDMADSLDEHITHEDIHAQLLIGMRDARAAVTP
jgi:hypothetical protein